MKERICLKDWERQGDKVKLIYEDGDVFYVSWEDFNRTTISFINGEKDIIRKEFAI